MKTTKMLLTMLLLATTSVVFANEYDFTMTDETAQEVVIGVWDVGTNPELFSEQLYSNPNEQPNGEDDDDNGQIDDIHGIASDIGETTNADLLYRPDDAVLAEYKPFLRGIMDLRAGMGVRVLHDAALADVGGREFELGFDEGDQRGGGSFVFVDYIRNRRGRR